MASGFLFLCQSEQSKSRWSWSRSCKLRLVKFISPELKYLHHKLPHRGAAGIVELVTKPCVRLRLTLADMKPDIADREDEARKFPCRIQGIGGIREKLWMFILRCFLGTTVGYRPTHYSKRRI